MVRQNGAEAIDPCPALVPSSPTRDLYLARKLAIAWPAASTRKHKDGPVSSQSGNGDPFVAMWVRTINRHSTHRPACGAADRPGQDRTSGALTDVAAQTGGSRHFGETATALTVTASSADVPSSIDHEPLLRRAGARLAESMETLLVAIQGRSFGCNRRVRQGSFRMGKGAS